MKNITKILAALLLSVSCMPLAAEEESSAVGVEFDFNHDGITDEKDWKELRQWVKDYKFQDGDVSNFGEQEVPATINLLIDEGYGKRASFTYDQDISSLPQFYLPSIGESTVTKDQNPFGTCWAFGTIAAVESNILHKRNGSTVHPEGTKLDFSAANKTLDLSELYHSYINMVPESSGSQKSEGLSPLNDGDNANFSVGGFISNSQSILTAWNGPVTEEAEPYTPLQADDKGANVYGLRNEADADRAATVAHVQDLVYLDSPSICKVNLDKSTYDYAGYDAAAVERIKQALLKYGAIMFCYAADNSMPGEGGVSDYMNYENWAQYDSNSTVSMNHMVTLVGWNDTFPKENFQTKLNKLPEGDGAFLVRNSWGDYYRNHEAYGQRLDDLLKEYAGTTEEYSIRAAYDYGIRDEAGHGTGYLWVSYYDHSIMDLAAVDVDDPDDGFDFDHLYQYDFSKSISFSPLSLPAADSSLKVANIFTAERSESLKAVSAYTPQPDSTVDVEIYQLNEGASLPDEGTLLFSKSFPVNEKGFHTLSLDEAIPLSENERFAVVERVTSAKDGKDIAWLNIETIIKPEIQTPDNINANICTVVSNPGESFIASGSDSVKWMDVQQFNETSDASQAFSFGNAYIKAYTIDDGERPAVSPIPDANPTPIPSQTLLFPKLSEIKAVLIGGAVVVILIIALIIYLIVRRRRRSKKQ